MMEGQEFSETGELGPTWFERNRAKVVVAVACLVVLIGGYLLVAHNGPSAGGNGSSADAAVVVVARAQRREVPLTLEAPGTVTPFHSVTIRSRVDGELRSVEFREGDEVRAGELLARIDPRPMEAALRQASASLRREQARLGNAAIEYQRAEALIKQGFVTQGSLDAKRTQLEQAKAEVDANRGMVDSASLQLGYAAIRSPIDGRTGFRLIDPGSLVSAAERTAIVVVTQQSPIAVVFALPQKDLAAVARGMRRYGRLAVELAEGQGGKVIARGHVTTFDNAIDRGSGTFQVKASFANSDRALWPGQYVQVRLIVDKLPNGIVVPLDAIQRGPDGEFVFLVDDKGIARMRAVTVEQRLDGMALLSRGLTGGETVVVDGQYGLRPGRQVRIASGPRR